MYWDDQVAFDFLGDSCIALCVGLLAAAYAALVGYWIHVRRNFFEAVPPKISDKSVSKHSVRYYNKMFMLEKDWAGLSNEERYRLRQKELKLLMKEFFAWCRKQKA